MGLFEMGMDSLMSVELRKRLERGAGRKLPATLTFNYPNVSGTGELPRSGTRACANCGGTCRCTHHVNLQRFAEGDLDSLSDEELEARLLARLSETK